MTIAEKSSFVTPLIVSPVLEKAWRVVEPFSYHVGNYPSEETINVPSGFMTDFASVPRIFWSILPPYWTYGKAAVIHDYLYITQGHGYTRKRADQLFREGMEVLGVKAWKRFVMYWFVRVFGTIPWYKRRVLGMRAHWEV